MESELDERKRKILKAIIQTYLDTGEPVGSFFSRIHRPEEFLLIKDIGYMSMN